MAKLWLRNWEDNEDRARMGRFSDTDQREMEELVRLRSRRRPSGLQLKWRKRIIDRGNGMRASFVLNNSSVRHSTEAVFKVLGTTKRAAGVARMVRYVGRLGQADKTETQSIVFRDEFHNDVQASVVQDHLKQWNLLPDDQNLSKKARSTKYNAEMNEAERLRNVQGWHFVFSVAEDSDDDEMADKLRRVMTATVDEVFSEAGFRVLWTLHRDHADHLHAHVIVKAVSRFGDKIRCDRAGEYTFGVRTIFAQNLQRAGLDYTATRREDRWRLRESIIAGLEPLRAYQHYKTHHLESDEDRQLRALWQDMFTRTEVSPPAQSEGPSDHWLKGWRANRRSKVLERDLKDVPVEYGALVRQLSGLYEDPAMACSAWVCLACLGAHNDDQEKPVRPNRKRALWELTHRPLQFGAFIQSPSPELIDKIVDAAKKTALPDYDPLAHNQAARRVSPENIKITTRRASGFSIRNAKLALISVCRVAEWLKGKPDGESKSAKIQAILLNDIKVARNLAPPSPVRMETVPRYNSELEEDLLERRQGKPDKEFPLSETVVTVKQENLKVAERLFKPRKPSRPRKKTRIDLS